MEFFAYAQREADAEWLQRTLTIGALPDWCGEIDTLLADHGDTGEIYCLWGQFRVHREAIRGGVRFTLPGCPNQLAWTITTGFPPAPEQITIHCTMARTEHEPDFVESTEAFVEAWRVGLEQPTVPG